MQKRMKNLVALALVLVLTVLCWGCGRQYQNDPVLQGGESTSESTTESTENTTESTENTTESTENTAESTESTQQEEPQRVILRTTYTKNFVDFTEYADVLEYHPEGELFGWEERFTDGCSTWCSVSQYEVTAIASSTLKPHGQYAYPASNVTVGNRENAWSEGAEGSGIGEYIEMEHTCTVGYGEYETDIGFTELCIVNGYAVTQKGWEENNRVKALKLYFMREYVATIILEDTILPQYIDISSLGLKVENGESAIFRFEISDVYRGTKYDDTCITGLLIEFSGRTPH